MKWLLIALVAFLGLVAALSSWQLVETHQAVLEWADYAARLEAQESPESAYYRGYIASCVGIGQKMSVPAELVAQTCGKYMADAYKADFFNELMPDTWTWPPVRD